MTYLFPLEPNDEQNHEHFTDSKGGGVVHHIFHFPHCYCVSIAEPCVSGKHIIY